jgi:hypothetical protein
VGRILNENRYLRIHFKSGLRDYPSCFYFRQPVCFSEHAQKRSRFNSYYAYDESTMTSWKSLEIVPREVISYINNLKCPVCKGKIANDGDDKCSSMDTGQDYVVWTYCAKDIDHYGVNLAWNDPKIIYLTDEDITFHYKNKEFRIHKGYEDSETKAHVLIYGLDELGHINEDDAISFDITFVEERFDFKKFNAAKFGALIKTLLIFR